MPIRLVQTRFSPVTYKELQTIARAHNSTVSALIRTAVDRLVERYYDQALKMLDTNIDNKTHS